MERKEGITKTIHWLDKGEYLVHADSPSAKHYSVFFKGKPIGDVVGVIRRGDIDVKE